MYRFIYLAAGFSRRYGANKLLSDFKGAPLFTHLLKELLYLAASRQAAADITVVTQYPAILDWCQAAGEGRSGLIRAVVNPDPSRGISSSLQWGLRAAEAARPWTSSDRIVCFVADQPLLKAKEVAAFLKACQEADARLACLGDGTGALGNPCLFSTEYLPELMALEGDVGGKRVILSHRKEVFIFREIGEEELWDIDTPPVK